MPNNDKQSLQTNNSNLQNIQLSVEAVRELLNNYFIGDYKKALNELFEVYLFSEEAEDTQTRSLAWEAFKNLKHFLNKIKPLEQIPQNNDRNSKNNNTFRNNNNCGIPFL